MHIAEENFYQWVWDGLPLSAAEQSHFDVCTTCQASLAALQRLAQELQIAQASTPTGAVLARYTQLYAQIEQAPSLAQRITTLITATLQWDGRQQPAWQGVRSTGVRRYRLLYMAPRAEVELMVEPQADRFTVEGELLPLTDEALLPALLELQDAATGQTLIETESDEEGRFHLSALSSGRYTLLITAPMGAALLLKDLEIS